MIAPFSVIPNRNIIVDLLCLSAFCSEALLPIEELQEWCTTKIKLQHYLLRCVYVSQARVGAEDILPQKLILARVNAMKSFSWLRGRDV